jgi:hypothetical protein
MRTAPLLGLALVLSACRAVDVRTPLPDRDALGRPKPLHDPPLDQPTGAWRWHVDTATLDGPVASPSDAHRGGLRVAVVSEAGLPGDAATHEVVEKEAVALPLGQGRWPGRPYTSPPLSDPIWTGADVCVFWVVALHPRGSCAVLVEAVPQLSHPSGCTAVLSDLRVRRVLGLDEALVIGVDPGDPAAEQAAVLVGMPPGKTGRFVLRVRG